MESTRECRDPDISVFLRPVFFSGRLTGVETRREGNFERRVWFEPMAAGRLDGLHLRYNLTVPADKHHLTLLLDRRQQL